MAIWDSIEADAASPAVPATMPDAPPMNVFDEIDENDEARKDDQVRTLFDLGLTKDADEHAGVLAVARQTGAPPNLVEMRYPEFELAARAARFDPRKFRRDNPELALFLVDHPWAAPVINKDEKFAGFKKWLRSAVATYQALSEEPPITKEVIRTLEDQQKFVAEQKTAVAGEMKRIEEAGQTKQTAYQESTLSGIDAFREEWGRGRLRSDINSLGATAMRLDAMAANAELNKAPPDEVARARQRAYDVHKHILEMEQRLGAQPDYQGGLVEQLALEAVNVTASEVDALKGMGAGGLAGAVLAGGGAAIVSKGSPSAIGAAARAGWRLGVPAGAFLSTFDQEAGSAYLDFLRQKDDAGKPMDPAIARGAAVVYGLASASIEVATIGPMLKMFGPIGEAIHSGEGRSFMRSLMQEQTKRALLKRVGAAWAKGSVTEALEEMSQQAAQIGIGYRAQTLSAGTPQSFDWGEAAAQTMEAGATTLIGTPLGIGAGGAVVHAAQGTIRLDQSKRAGAVVAGLAQLPDSPIARAAPKELAKLLRAETERVGEPVTSVYIDPAQLTRYFQGDKADSDAAARELLGENGPDRIRDAIARQTAEPGGRATLEVPLAEYLEKFGTKGIAEALVPDTTTRAGYLTRRERIELRQRNADYMQQRTQELLAQAEEEPQSPGESALVSALQKQLAATGMGEQKARVSIAQMRAFLETQAADFGVPVDQLFAAKAISIEREGASRGVPATTLAQPEAPRQDDQTGKRPRPDPDKAIAEVRALREANPLPESPAAPQLPDVGAGKLVLPASLKVIEDKVGLPIAEGALVPDANYGPYLNEHNLLSAEGYAKAREVNPKAVEASARVLGVDKMREAFGPEATQVILDHFSRMISRAGGGAIDAAQIADGRYAAQHDNPDIATGFFGDLADDAKRLVFFAQRQDGSFVLQKGVDFSHGAEGTAQSAAEAGPVVLGSRSDLDREIAELVRQDAAYEFRDLSRFVQEELRQEVRASDGDAVAAGAREEVVPPKRGEQRTGSWDASAEVGAAQPAPAVDLKSPRDFIKLYHAKTAEEVAELDAARAKGGYPAVLEANAKIVARRPEADVDTFLKAEREREAEALRRGEVREPGKSVIASEVIDRLFLGNKTRLYQPAWHGTPHRGISRFLLDKIGTGQAAQSFGHGLYFAEKQDVAEFYRSTLAGRPSIKVDGREVWGPNTVTVRSLEEDGQTTVLSRLAMAANMPAVMGGTTRPDAQETIGHLINELMQSLAVNQDHLDRALAAAHGDDQASRVKSAKKTLAHLNEQLRTLQDLRGRNVEFVAAGQTYKANVPENDVLLDYDRAIADQPEHVKDALRRLGIDEHRVDVHVRGADANDVYVFSGMKQAQEFAETERRTEGRVVEVVVRDDESQLTGRDVYESLAKDLGSDREASAALLKEGVPGLRYLDQGSRSQHEGTHNFVIWDEDAIQVLDTLYQGRVPATDTPEFRIWFGSSKVVDENGVPKVVYHGAKRPDRIGTRFRKSRATSGPMAFFTDSPELASKYAEGKADTSLEAPEDYAGWFKFKVGRSTVDISRAWWFLSPEKRAEVGSKLPHVERDEATGAFRLGEGYGLADKGHWEYEIQAARGNVLKAAVETWLNSAGLFDEEEEFLKVLKLAGLEDVEFDSPWTEYPSVFPVYLSIQNPLVTSEIPDGVVRALEKASRRQRSPGEKPGLDPWHKSARDPRDWVQQLKSDLAGGVSSFVWTSIPDWVTKTLKGLGYDGIQDTGGKKGGQEHVVWIPFEETQVKSASGNRGTFDPHNPNILKQGDSSTPRGWVDVAKQGVTKTFRVFLSKEADLSTFLHESSHIYLEMLGDLAAREDAPERVRQTYSDALAWLGVKSRGEITTEHHEKWASAFEAYLREGKAPSSKLAEAFEEFRIWLREIYKSLGMLRATPNDEIRNVFSRMLATDWEIAAAQESMGADKLIPDGVLSPEQHQAYLRDRERISAEAARKLRAARAQEEDRLASKAWRDEVAANVEKAEAEYEKRQDHRAALFLRSGELVDANGRRLESLGDAKLSSDVIWEALKPDRKSIDQAKRLLRGRLSPRGEDFTWVATDVLGFKDVREMLRAFLVLPERAAWVKERAEDMALEAHPEVAEARERAHEEMIRALHDEGSTDSLLKEWAAMRARGGVPGLPPAEAIKAAARELVAKRPVSWLMSRPYLLLEQERRAAERAVAHAAKGDFAAAADAKKAQLLAHYEYREVEEGIEERERFEALVKKLNDAKARARMGVAGADFRRTADRILVAIGARDQEPAQEGSEPKPAWAIYRDLEQMDITPAFSPEELESVLAQGRPWREMPLTEIRQIRQILAQLYAAAREQNMVMLEGKRVALAEVAHAIGTEARALPDKGPLAASESAIARKWLAKNRIRTQSGTMAVQDFLAGLTEPKVMMDELGPTATKTLWHGYLAARTAEDELAQSVAKFFAETWDRLPKAMQRSRFDLLTDLDGVPFPADLNREGSARDRQWMWMVALNMGNASNMTRLLGGYKWDEATVRAWLDRNMTKEEWDFVQGVWDLLDKELYPKVAAQYERVNGIAPEKIAPVEFQTKWGIYRGGYFPARYDPVASRLGQNQAQEALTTLYAQKAGQYSVAKSFTKGRAEKYSDVVRLEWGIVPSHIGQVIHYVTHDQFLRDAAKIINNAEFSTTVQRRLGAKYMPQVQAWLRTVASSQADAMPEELSGLVRPFQAARSRFVMTTLGYSLSVAAGDLTNPLVAAAAGRIKARYMTPALLRAIPLATYGATRRAALEKSPELRRRSMQLRSNLMRQLSDVGRRGARGAPARIVEAIRESSWFLMEATDRLGSTIIWEGAYRQAIARDGVSEAQAIQEADSAVQDFLPSHDPGDLPTALRDKRFIGSMVVFYSYFSKLANIGRRTMKPAFDEWDNAEGFGATLQTAPTVAAAAGRYLAVLLVASVLGEFLSGRGPDDDEEVPEWVLRKLLASPGFLVPFFGPALEVGVNTGVAYAFHGEARWRPFSMRGSPSGAAMEVLVRSLANAADSDRDGDQRLWDLLALVGFGANLGIGSNQVTRMGRYMTGEEGFRDDFAQGDIPGMLGGAIYGDRPNQPANPASVFSTP